MFELVVLVIGPPDHVHNLSQSRCRATILTLRMDSVGDWNVPLKVMACMKGNLAICLQTAAGAFSLQFAKRCGYMQVWMQQTRCHVASHPSVNPHNCSAQCILLVSVAIPSVSNSKFLCSNGGPQKTCHAEALGEDSHQQREGKEDLPVSTFQMHGMQRPLAYWSTRKRCSMYHCYQWELRWRIHSAEEMQNQRRLYLSHFILLQKCRSWVSMATSESTGVWTQNGVKSHEPFDHEVGQEPRNMGRIKEHAPVPTKTGKGSPKPTALPAGSLSLIHKVVGWWLPRSTLWMKPVLTKWTQCKPPWPSQKSMQMPWSTMTLAIFKTMCNAASLWKKPSGPFSIRSWMSFTGPTTNAAKPNWPAVKPNVSGEFGRTWVKSLTHGCVGRIFFEWHEGM